MKRILTVALTLILVATASLAQKKDSRNHEQWMNELRKAKVEYMTRELELTSDQEERFATVYNSMQSELDKLRREIRALHKSIEEKKDATDLEYEKAAETAFEFKSREGAIEQRYYQQFKQILTPRQLYKFQSAEKKWMKTLMKHRKK